MTFGVNALDWTNIGRKLQNRMAETVGEALTLPTESTVLSPFAYYDGATGTVLTTYSAYLDTSMADAFTPAEVVTVKTDEDGSNVVVDVTPLKLLYVGVDAEGNQIVTTDSSVDGVDVDPDSGRSISILTNQASLPAEYNDNLQQIYQDAVDADTGWSPTYALSSGDSPTQVESVEELENSDSTSWVRVKQRNGTESIYYFLPYNSEAEYTTLVDTIPTTFTFDDGLEVYTAEPTDEPFALASTVEATSLDSNRLSSTYESTLTDLNTAYEALVSPSTDDGSTDDGSSDDDGADIETSAFERAIVSVQIWVSDNLVTPIGEYKYWVLGGMGVLAFLFIYRRLGGSKEPEEEKQTLGQLLDNAIGSGKEIDG